MASKHGEKIAQVFVDAMDDENPHSVRMKGAEALLKVEEKEARLKMDEEEHLRELGKDALVAAIAKRFHENPMALNIFRQAGESKELSAPASDEEEVVDAEVVG